MNNTTHAQDAQIDYNAIVDNKRLALVLEDIPRLAQNNSDFLFTLYKSVYKEKERQEQERSKGSLQRFLNQTVCETYDDNDRLHIRDLFKAAIIAEYEEDDDFPEWILRPGEYDLAECRAYGMTLRQFTQEFRKRFIFDHFQGKGKNSTYVNGFTMESPY